MWTITWIFGVPELTNKKNIKFYWAIKSTNTHFLWLCFSIVDLKFDEYLCIFHFLLVYIRFSALIFKIYVCFAKSISINWFGKIEQQKQEFVGLLMKKIYQIYWSHTCTWRKNNNTIFRNCVQLFHAFSLNEWIIVFNIHFLLYLSQKLQCLN